jgi:hypothetical protein
VALNAAVYGACIILQRAAASRLSWLLDRLDVAKFRSQIQSPLLNEESNAPGEIRTHGPRIRNPVLYPPELRGHKEYQLVTIIFFSLRVKLCLTVPKNFRSAIFNEPFEIAHRILFLGFQEMRVDPHRD